MCRQRYVDFWTPTEETVYNHEVKIQNQHGEITEYELGVSAFARLDFFECQGEFLKTPRCATVTGPKQRLGGVKNFCRSDRFCADRSLHSHDRFDTRHRPIAEMMHFHAPVAQVQAALNEQQGVLEEWRQVYNYHVNCPSKRMNDPEWQRLMAAGIPIAEPGSSFEGHNPNRNIGFQMRMINNPHHLPNVA